MELGELVDATLSESTKKYEHTVTPRTVNNYLLNRKPLAGMCHTNGANCATPKLQVNTERKKKVNECVK